MRERYGDAIPGSTIENSEDGLFHLRECFRYLTFTNGWRRLGSDINDLFGYLANVPFFDTSPQKRIAVGYRGINGTLAECGPCLLQVFQWG